MSNLINKLTDAIRFHAEVVRQDLGWTMRSLRRSAGFTITAIIVAAMGIGATTAAFTLLDHVLLRPLPFTHPEQLAMVYQTQMSKGYSRIVTSPANFRDWQSMGKSFESMGGYSSISVNLSGKGEPQRLNGAAITSDVLNVLEVKPAIGRGFNADDDREGAPDVVLLSDSLASAMYGSAAAALNSTIRLDNQPHTIIGVMPAGFAFPSREMQLWTPLRFPASVFTDPEDRANLYVSVVARLRQGVSVDQARAEMNLVGQQLERAYAKENAGVGVTVVGMHDVLSPQSQMLVVAVFGAAFCVILIACANLANLLFARFMVRKREIAVRIALGAVRERILRQLLTENLVLAIAGGALGLLLGAIATPSLARLVPDALPISGVPQMNLRVFAFTVALTIVTCVAFGMAPALRASRQVDLDTLRGRSAVAGRSDRIRTMLVLAEVVCTIILLVGSALLVKALWRVQSVDPGFRADNVLTLRTTLPLPKYNDEASRTRFYSQVLTKTRALPGVTSASYISFLPMVFRGGIFPVTVPGTAIDETASVQATIRFVTTDFFTTLGIPLRGGRDINDRDTFKAPFVAVISESLAHRLWPGQDPLGHKLNVAFFDRTVVGVVSDISTRGLERTSEPQIYLSSQQVQDGFLPAFAPKDLVVRASGNPVNLAPSLRNIIHEVDPEQSISDVRLLQDIVLLETDSRRSQLRVLGAFTIIAFLLAGVGIYGLLSFAVSTRIQEVGVRLALGATPRNILNMFLRRGLILGVLGLAIGLPLAYLAARAIAVLLFNVEPDDLLIYAGTSLLVLLMILVGSFVPALRAARVSPTISIRE
ncbi:MAG TPA: ABC transporter permease [Pyrinomonadaceae bacterium]|nr:ABC transporter permease [Pyrinomonadaceae bacterium]